MMEKVKERVVNPIKSWRRKGEVEKSSRWVGEHAGYDNTPLPRLTTAGFWMGILVSMGGFVFGYGYFSLFSCLSTCILLTFLSLLLHCLDPLQRY
jgi:hypothetical protein